MSDTTRVTAIVGTYRKGGMVDQAVDEILASARAEGAETRKIYLLDADIQFCRNCRTCTQDPREGRGTCPITDDMKGILDEIERSDAFILASPMNFWSVTAVTKRFIERLVCFAYWPWGAPGPAERSKLKKKRAVVVATSAAPALLARSVTRMVGLLKRAASLLGARQTAVLFVGMAAQEQAPTLKPRAKRRAQRLGKRLAATIR